MNSNPINLSLFHLVNYYFVPNTSLMFHYNDYLIPRKNPVIIMVDNIVASAIGAAATVPKRRGRAPLSDEIKAARAEKKDLWQSIKKSTEENRQRT